MFPAPHPPPTVIPETDVIYHAAVPTEGSKPSVRPVGEVGVNQWRSLTKKDILALDNWDDIPNAVLREVINDPRCHVFV